MDIYTEAGHRIRELREMHHYSREQLAELVGISPKFLYEIEHGRKGFSAYVLSKMSEVFEVSADYILTGKYESAGTEQVNILLGRLQIIHKENVEKLLEIICEMCVDDL